MYSGIDEMLKAKHRHEIWNKTWVRMLNGRKPNKCGHISSETEEVRMYEMPFKLVHLSM